MVPGMEESVDSVVDQLLNEADIDGSATLSFDEFAKLISRMPDLDAKLTINLQEYD